MKIAAVQIPITSDLATNLVSILDAIRIAETDKIEVLAFPECALTGYAVAAVEANVDNVPQGGRSFR